MRATVGLAAILKAYPVGAVVDLSHGQRVHTVVVVPGLLRGDALHVVGVVLLLACTQRSVAAECEVHRAQALVVVGRAAAGVLSGGEG